MFTMYETKRRLTPLDLDELEKRLSISLPDQYRTWLLKFNGGQPVPGRFSLDGGETLDGVAWFFAVHDGEFNNFETEFIYWTQTTKRLPDNLVPIATDGSGNLICLSFGGDDKGKVYFWEHESEAEPSYDQKLWMVTIQ